MNLGIKKVASAIVRKSPNNISQKIGRTSLVAGKHAPAILFTGGLVGIVATVVLSSRATLKMDKILEETQEKVEKAKQFEAEGYSEKDRQKDLATIYVRASGNVLRLYGPAVLVGLASVCALTGSHIVLTRRNVSLTAAYAAIERGYSEYRRRVVEEFGEDKERELRHGTVNKEIVDETDEGTLVTTIKRVDPSTHSPYARFFDQLSPNWNKTPEYNLLFLSCQQTFLNNLLQSRGHVFLNEMYDALGIERSGAGAVVGWVISRDGDNFIDFGLYDKNNERARDFVNGREGAILIDPNVDGVIYDKI